MRGRLAGLGLCVLAIGAPGQTARGEPRDAQVSPSEPSIPPHNRSDLSEPPPRPDVGDAAEKARRLFEAIRRDDPSLARDFFFPADAFLLVKATPHPDRYHRRLFARYERDIHALHAQLEDVADAEFVRFELARRGGWVKVGEEGNHLPYWVSRHSFLYYRVGKRERRLEVRVLITWDDHWYITHLSEFH